MSPERNGLPQPLTDEEVGKMMCRLVVDGVAWLRPGAAPAPAYTVTTSSSGRAEDWWPADWEKAAAREAWRTVLERERVAAVRSACAELLAGLDGLPAARAGRPVTAVALVLDLRRR